MCYREFCTSRELFDLLIERFNVPDLQKNNDSDSEFYPATTQESTEFQELVRRYQREYQQPIKLKVINVFKHWIDGYFYDFQQDLELFDSLKLFIKQLGQKNRRLQQVLEKSLKKKLSAICSKSVNTSVASSINDLSVCSFSMNTTNDGYINLDNINESNYPASISWLEEQNGYDIMTIHPLEFAKQATLIESELYQKIQPNELINLGWTKENKNELSPNVMRCINFWNRFTYWYSKCIVDTYNFEERCAVMQRILDIANYFWDFNNFSGLKQIFAALETSSLTRLQATREKVGIENHPIYEKLRNLFDDHECGYFERLKHCNPPCVPFIGAHLAPIFKKYDYHDFYEDKQQQHIQELQQQQLNNPRNGSAGSNNSSSDSMNSGSNNSMSSSDSRSGMPPVLISFSKYRRLVDFVIELLQYQNISYKFRLQKRIRDYIYEDIDTFIQKAASQPNLEDENFLPTSPINKSPPTNFGGSMVVDRGSAIEQWLYNRSKYIEPEPNKCNIFPPKRSYPLKVPRNLKQISQTALISSTSTSTIERSTSITSANSQNSKQQQQQTSTLGRHQQKHHHQHQTTPHSHKKADSLSTFSRNTSSSATQHHHTEKLSVSSSAEDSAPNSPPPNYDDVFQTTSNIQSCSSPTLNNTQNCFDNLTYFVRPIYNQAVQQQHQQLAPPPQTTTHQSQRRSMASTISLSDYPLHCSSSSSSPKVSSANQTTKQTTFFNFPNEPTRKMQQISQDAINLQSNQAKSDLPYSSSSSSSLGRSSPLIPLQPPPTASNRNRKQ